MTLTKVHIVYGYQFDGFEFLEKFYDMKLDPNDEKDFDTCVEAISDICWCSKFLDDAKIKHDHKKAIIKKYPKGIHLHLDIIGVPHDQVEDATNDPSKNIMIVGIEFMSLENNKSIPLTVDKFPSKPTKEELYEKIPAEYKKLFANLEPSVYMIQDDCACCS